MWKSEGEMSCSFLVVDTVFFVIQICLFSYIFSRTRGTLLKYFVYSSAFLKYLYFVYFSVFTLENLYFTAL